MSKQINQQINKIRGGQLMRLVCKKCKHTWISRVEYPQKCPKCFSAEWKGKNG